MNEKMQELLEKSKALSDAITNLTAQMYGEGTQFILVVPEHQTMASNVDPLHAAFCLSQVVTSVVGNAYRIQSSEDDFGNDNAESLN